MGREVIRASEVGQYVYCARAWWLGRVRGYRSINVAALEAGRAAHRRHGRAVARHHRLRRLAYVLLALAVVAGAAFLVSVMGR